MTQNIQNYIDEIEDYVGGNIEGNQIGIDRMGFTVFLRTTLTKVVEEARREGFNDGRRAAFETIPNPNYSQQAVDEEVAKAVKAEHERIVEWTKDRIADPQYTDDTTYGYTNHRHDSVVYGINEALDLLITHLQSDK